MPFDVRLVAIADPAVLGPRDLLAAARAAEGGGATLLQLRFKHAPASVVLRAAAQLVPAVGLPVFVNDRADVAWAAAAAGVHLGADDLPAGRVRAVAPPPFGIGVSVGSEAEARAARGAAVDYWSLGPIYATGTKADAGSPIGAAGFRALALRAPTGVPLIAIGGITAANVGEIIAAGARGVAVVSAIFAARDIERATRTLRDAVDAALARQR